MNTLFSKGKISSVLLVMMLLIVSACGDGANASKSNGKGEANFPTKPIKIVVGFPAGGIADLAARSIAESMGSYLPNDVNVVVENKPGGNGVVAMAEVTNAAADGYTISYAPTGPMTIHPHYGRTPYEPTDPTPISMVNTSSFIVAVHPDAPWDDMESFIADAKENPGQYSFGQPGTGSLPDIAMRTLEDEAGIELKSVPFEGNAPARTALLGKDVDAVVLMQPDVAPFVKNGELKALMHFSDEPIEGLPDVPTTKDVGYDISFEAASFIYGPKDLPEDIRIILDKAIEEMTQDPKLIEHFDNIEYTTKYMNSKDLTEVLKEEFEKNGKIIKNSGLN